MRKAGAEGPGGRSGNRERPGSRDGDADPRAGPRVPGEPRRSVRVTWVAVAAHVHAAFLHSAHVYFVFILCFDVTYSACQAPAAASRYVRGPRAARAQPA